jgi:outer membrane protein TolC
MGLEKCVNLFRFALLFLLGFAYLAETSVSFADPQNLGPLSLADCLSRVEKESVQVAQTVVSQAKANAALKEAYQPRLPQLVAQENLADAQDPIILSPDSNKAVIRIEQGTLPFFGSTWRLAQQKQLEWEVARLSVVESVQDVRLLVKQLYFSILRDQDIIASLGQVEKEFDRLVATVVPKYQIGRAPSFDVVKVRSSTYDLARTRDLTRSLWIGEKSQLNEILRLGGTGFDLLDLRKTPDISTAQIGLAENPTLAGLQKTIESADATVSVTRAQRLPSLSAALEYGFEGTTPTTMVNTWTVTAQLRLTLFDWGLISAQVEEAEATTALAQKKLEAETQRSKSDYDQTVALGEAHLADQKRLEALLPELKRAAAAAVGRYKVGGMSIIEVTDAINLWLQGLINEKTAYYSYLSDLAKIERLSGRSTIQYE